MKKVVGSFTKFNLAESTSGEEIYFRGCVTSVKETKYITFAIISYGQEVFQIVLSPDLDKLSVGMSVKGSGEVKQAKLSNTWLSCKTKEIQVHSLSILSTSHKSTGIDWSKKVLNVSGEAFFNERPISLRHEREKAIFYIQNIIVETFRSCLCALDFVEMRTPKLSALGAEGGANVFSLNYFGQTAFLSQSPQFYKEFGTGVFQKVFEVGPVFRAEKHNTSRHLNEYNSMDLEFGPIESFAEVMQLEVLFLTQLMENLKIKTKREQEILGISIPNVESIPSLTFCEVKEILKERGISGETNDLSPKEEKEIGKYALEHYASEFIFITHYPVSCRPFYTAREKCPYSSQEMTASFDLLFRGLEITTGGQRIHEYEKVKKSIEENGLELSEFEFFLQAHAAGLPPHGGFGLGLERLTAQLVGESSVKHCILYPRDTTRLSP